MTKLVWDKTSERIYETGVSKGVLFTQDIQGGYDEGVAWNGLTSVSQSNDGAEPNDLYADNIKYLTLMSAENHQGTIEAYTYPAEFEACDGSATINPGVFVGQQTRTPFGMVYSTIVGNDTEGNRYGEKLHFVYNARVSPSERAYESVNETPDAITFSWEYTTTPVDLSEHGLDPSAGVTVSKTEVGETLFNELVDIVHGTEEEEPRLPSLSEVITMTKAGTEPDPEA